jgi:hypothetical protein
VPDNLFDMLFHTTIVDLTLRGVDIQPSRFREIRKFGHGQLHRFGISSSENEKIISKA